MEPDAVRQHRKEEILSEMLQRAEEALWDAEESLRLLVEAARDYAFIMLDSGGRIVSWSEGAERILGYRPDEIIGQSVDVLFRPEDVREGIPEQELDQARREGSSTNDRPHVRKDGSTFWSSGMTRMIDRRMGDRSARPAGSIPPLGSLRDAEGNLRGFAMILRDLSDRHQMEEKLRRSEERLRLLVESATDYAIFTMDVERIVDSWNPGAERLTGYREEEILGQSGDILFTPEDLKKGAPIAEATQALREGRAEDERWHVRKDGSRFRGSGVVTPMRDSSGRHIGFAKIMRDITGRVAG